VPTSVLALENCASATDPLYPRLRMIRVTTRRRLRTFGLILSLPILVMGCPKKPPTPAIEDAGAPPPATTPTVTELAPLTEEAGAEDAAPETGPKKWTGPGLTANQLKLAACCGAMRTQAKAVGASSPEGFQLNAAAVYCDSVVKQVGPAGTAPEFAQVRAMLKSVKLPAACQF
jgi:hypothetical protein